ncbi:hypothetical protein BH10PSE13_BH10PSE13_08340 [soil metagenome]
MIPLILMVAAITQGAAYWPGIMTWDSINQYGQSTSGVFDDWHPPVMAWLWRQLIAIKAGPAPMFVIQVALYWTGYGLILADAFRRRQAKAAIVVTIGALMPFPLAIMGSVLKDCLMEGLLLTAVGLFVWSGPQRGWAVRLPAMLLLVAAGLLRFNAFLATLPLLVALLPTPWRRTWLRSAIAALLFLPLLLLSMPIANRFIGADDSGVQLSLVIFDLGGITKNTGIDMFPPIGVADPVAVNGRCYHPVKWDSYSSWADPECPISFERIDAWMTEKGARPIAMLAQAIYAHPLAYAEHRLAHFNINARFLIHDEVEGPAPDKAIENEWGFIVPTNPALRLINQLAVWSIHSPLGWPIWWMALASGLLILSRSMPSRWLIAPITLSALAYGLGYLVFSVSSELRYHLWTITGTMIAAAYVTADLLNGHSVSRNQVVASLAPALCVGVLCAVWRLG